MRYFLFKTRSVCHLCPGELTHSGRKYDIHVAVCNLGKLWMDGALMLSLLSFSCSPDHLLHPSPLRFCAYDCSRTKHCPSVFVLACGQLLPLTLPAWRGSMYPEPPKSLVHGS